MAQTPADLSSASSADSIFATLTKRERSILELLIKQSRDKDTAALLGINIKTVKFHKTKIYKKLGVVNAVGAALAYQKLAGTAPEQLYELERLKAEVAELQEQIKQQKLMYAAAINIRAQGLNVLSGGQRV